MVFQMRGIPIPWHLVRKGCRFYYALNPGVVLRMRNSDQQLEHKEGIEKAVPGKVFSRQWRVKVF